LSVAERDGHRGNRHGASDAGAIVRNVLHQRSRLLAKENGHVTHDR
jgi:hypothetical protein